MVEGAYIRWVSCNVSIETHGQRTTHLGGSKHVTVNFGEVVGSPVPFSRLHHGYNTRDKPTFFRGTRGLGCLSSAGLA